jgi:Domain of unknown function (DUF4158)
MTAIYETAYPRIRSNPSDAELQELYTPTPSDPALARRAPKSPGTELGLLVLLTTFRTGLIAIFATGLWGNAPHRPLISFPFILCCSSAPLACMLRR